MNTNTLGREHTHMKKLTREQDRAVREFAKQVDSLWDIINDGDPNQHNAMQYLSATITSPSQLLSMMASDIESLSRYVKSMEN